MARRYSVYERAIKLNKGQVNATSPLGEYQKAKTGQKDVEYDRAEGSNPGQYTAVYIEPFTFALATGNKLEVMMSQRAFDRIGSLLDTPNLLGHATKPADAENITSNELILPAKAIVSVLGVKGTPKESKVTGVKYTPRNADSYTIPFGKVGTDTFFACAIALRNAIKAKNPDKHRVNITPEIIRGL